MRELKLITLFLFAANSIVSAQIENLVNNGSFESIDEKPVQWSFDGVNNTPDVIFGNDNSLLGS